MNNSRVSILVPVFNDWTSLNLLLTEIDKVLSSKFQFIDIIVINDCSSKPKEINKELSNNINLNSIDLISNVGHQRAILIGLCWIYDSNLTPDSIIVMDADGEDDPNYIIDLFKESIKKENIVFASRNKRSENIVFKISYFFYKILFKLLTGKSISFGNFSSIPALFLQRICSDYNFWNHYSSSVMVSKIPFSSIMTNRRNRFDGYSKMNHVSLVMHGLSSISVYIEIVIYRLILFLSILTSIFLALALFLIYLRFFTELTIPGWSSNILFIIFTNLFILFMFFMTFLLMHLNSRKTRINSPLSFYKEYINEE